MNFAHIDRNGFLQNEWLRVASAVFLSAVAKMLNMADVHCKVMPLVNGYLRQPLIKLDKEAVILRCLRDPLGRSVWDMVVRSPFMLELMDFLRDKHLLRQLSLSPAQPMLGFALEGGADGGGFGFAVGQPPMVPENPQLANFYQKLINQGLSEESEERLLAFRETLVKMRKMKARCV